MTGVWTDLRCTTEVMRTPVTHNAGPLAKVSTHLWRISEPNNRYCHTLPIRQSSPDLHFEYRPSDPSLRRHSSTLTHMNSRPG